MSDQPGWIVPPSFVRCPVDECDWTRHLVVNSVMQYPTLEAMEHAVQRMWAQHEAALRDHSVHHSPMEYLRTIHRLRGEVLSSVLEVGNG